MIIKEFRIVIPMSVEEYQIGQLYTIQKKSRLESTGAGSGVEIIENKPYESNKEKGQYTLKVYHVDERLPSALKTISKLLFPKSALLFEEESWNCYPYTRTKYRHKLFKSFSIDIESKYLADYGQTENVFNLKSSELSNRVVDYIDIVCDPINPNEYKLDEDPSKFQSNQTQRGPLSQNWFEELKLNANQQTSQSVLNKKQIKYMCAYKLCRIECAFWGCQSRVEKLISESVLRHMILMSHRQAWCWQDEYFDLSMDDVRKLEQETQEYLMAKMGNGPNLGSSKLELNNKIEDRKSVEKDKKLNQVNEIQKDEKSDYEDFQSENEALFDKVKKTNEAKIKNTRVGFENIFNDDSDFGDNEDDDIEKDEHLDTKSQASNLDEFYDAISQASFSLSIKTIDSELAKSTTSLNTPTTSVSFSPLTPTTGPKTKHKILSKIKQRNNSENIEKSKPSIDYSPSSSSSSSSGSSSSKTQSSKIDTLIIVVHGGNITCTDTSKQSDFLNFKSTIENVLKQSYGNLYGHIAYRLVACEPICKEALIKLSALSPVANQQSFSSNESDNFAETSAAVFSLHENLPFSTLPLLALANQTEYKNNLIKFIRECNKAYQSFLSSNEGKSFQGQVIVVGDSLGSILVYDSLCQPSGNTSNCSDDSSTLASSVQSSNTNLNTKSLNSNYTTPNPSPISNRKIESPVINLNDKILLDDTNSEQKQMKRSASNSSYTSGIEFIAGTNLTTTNNQQLNQSVSLEEKLDFDVTHFFVFGSPLGLILAYRKFAYGILDLPCCTQIYNMFHLTDPIAVRIEPLLSKQFRFIEPCMVPRYSKFPLGDGSNLSLDHFIVKHGNLFDTKNLLAENEILNNKFKNERINSLIINDSSNNYLTPNFDQLKSLQKIIQTKKNWWGDNRIDYVLYAPEKISNLPKKSLPYIFHSCFWESTDVVSFMLRMIFKSELHSHLCPAETTVSTSQKEPVEKWQKRMNRVKLRNLSSNHRANDVIVLEDKEQILSAKFSYGPLDFALSGEKVDIYIMPKLTSLSSSSNNGDWKFYASELTDNHGKLKYQIPKEKRLPLGMYQIKMVVKCDHTFAEFHMSVLPANTEAVVFSIDGSFAANISFSGTDPKVRAGAVDVVRHWQDLGYLIIYITARPDIQHYKVTNWLAQHNFPLGMVYFSDGISRDPIKQKTETLRNIVLTNNIKLEAAYGSSKDIQMYSSLGLNSNRIFIIGKLKSKYSNQAIILKDGYASHLNMLQNPSNGIRQANGNARLVIKKISFSIKQNTMFSTSNENNRIDINKISNSINKNNSYIYINQNSISSI